MFLHLNDLSMDKVKRYGRKAVFLGELHKLGVNVPKGFAISVEVYEEFLSYNKFSYNSEQYIEQSKNIKDFILKGDFSENITKTLHQYFESLNLERRRKCFAVRSSAICEDSETYSMAGVFSSYINLQSFDDLIEAIKKCYASLFSDRALVMMTQYNIPNKDLKMGIIVQEFIEGSLSGVAFSADTVKMDSEAIVINAVNSICADYVESKYPSSVYRINKTSCQVIDTIISPQTPVLSLDIIKVLYKEILFIENSLGCYQDIEWTIKDSTLYILQTRPITTFRSHCYPENWFKNSDLKDTLILFEDKALTPLQQSIRILWQKATSKGLEYSSKGRNGRCIISNGYFYSAIDERDWDKRAKFRAWLEELLVEGRNIFQDIQLPQIISLRKEIRQLIDEKEHLQELISILNKAIRLFEISVEVNVSAVDGGCVPLEAFEKYCKAIDSSLTQDDYYDLVYGVSKLSEEREQIIRLSLLVKSSTDLMDMFDNCLYDVILYYRLKHIKAGQELLNGIDNYIGEYGLTTVNGQWQFDSSILLEQPWFVISKIRACLDIDSQLFFHSREASLNNKEKVIKNLTANLSADSKTEFLTKLKGAEKAFLVNDDHCFYLDLSGFGYLRLALIKTSDILNKVGVIEKSEEIEFLTLEEVRNTLWAILDSNFDMKYRDTILNRKTEYKIQKQVIPPKYIGILPAEKTQDNPQSAEENLTIIEGISGLQKKVQGKVKVITNNNNICLQEPSIIVLRDGHSCYFLPFLNKIKGLIYDGGSPYDHPGIIARELSIPSIYNTQIATRVLKDGDLVELDGVKGCVIVRSS